MTAAQLAPNCSATGRRPTGWRSAAGLDRFLSVYVAFIAVGAALAGYREFTLWSQVTDLEGSNPITLFLAAHPSAVRFAVVWPIFAIADVLGDLDPNAVFTAVGVGCTVGLMHLSAGIATKMGSTSQLLRTKASLFWLFFFLVFFGGRLVLALFGFALILEAQISLISNARNKFAERWRLLRMMLGIVLCAVGSGMFFVAVAVATIFFVARFSANMMNRRRIRRNAALVVGGALLWIAPPIVKKNWALLDTWDIESLLQHGFGLALLPLVVVGALLLVPALPMLLAPVDGRRLLYRAALIALCGGIFGFSALSMITVPLGALFAAGPKIPTPTAGRAANLTVRQSTTALRSMVRPRWSS